MYTQRVKSQRDGLSKLFMDFVAQVEHIKATFSKSDADLIRFSLSISIFLFRRNGKKEKNTAQLVQKGQDERVLCNGLRDILSHNKCKYLENIRCWTVDTSVLHMSITQHSRKFAIHTNGKQEMK